MKPLLDLNLSPRLVERLSDIYPDSAHVSEFGLSHAQDNMVSEHARDHGFFIVSKDVDFTEMSVVRGFPPKVIWVRRGNCSTREIERILRDSFQAVGELAHSSRYGVLLLK